MKDQISGEQFVRTWLKGKTNQIISYAKVNEECWVMPVLNGQKTYSAESWSRFFRTVRNQLIAAGTHKFPRYQVKNSRAMHWKIIKIK